MCKEERTVNQETNVQEKEARVRQPWTAQRVGDILLNNALLIIMAIAVVYIAIKNRYDDRICKFLLTLLGDREYPYLLNTILHISIFYIVDTYLLPVSYTHLTLPTKLEV